MENPEANDLYWDMTSIFPSLESPEFAAEFDAVVAGIGDLAAQFDAANVRRRDESAVDAAWVAQWESIVNAVNTFYTRLGTLRTYISCHTTTDARNDVAKARASQLETQSVALGKLDTRLVAWIGSSDIETLIEMSPLAQAHEFYIRRARELFAHQMSETEESLAAELAPMGLSGWARLHSNLSALLTATVTAHDESRILPVSAIRSLASDPDRAVRQAAFEAEIPAWQSVATSMAASLNSIKGFQRTLHAKRGYADDIEPTLLRNSIDRETLEAMQSACVAAFPDFRRYMDAKARALGLEKLSWFDMLAPLGKMESAWSWPAAETMIEDNFRNYSDKMADFARRSFDERWIDVESRVGKVGGAYCAGIRPGESRVLMNFDGSFTSVSTLAHELGHAYHNLCLAERTPLQKQTPMTLAETASIFCETIVFEAAVADADRTERIALLDNAMSRNLQVVVDIHSRFLFEKGVFEKRAARELTEAEFCELMTQSQRATYGTNMEPLHPYMWAVKGHYYGPTFYNYPYTFGLLFGLGLYACYRRDPEGFKTQYDDFLSSCGLADARTLGQRFGLDVTSVEFWTSSLDVIRGQINEFEQLISTP